MSFLSFRGLPLLLPGVRLGGAAYVESVFYACRLFSCYGLYVCCGGLLGAVAVVFVVLCCLAWAVGVFGCAAAGAAACRRRWVYLGCWGGVRVLYRGVLYVCGV